MLYPTKGRVLVRLASRYANVTATTKIYESATSGEVVAIAPEDTHKNLVGKTVYWSEMMAGNPIIYNEEMLVTVKVENIEAVEVGK
jgi:hypothetical protein